MPEAATNAPAALGAVAAGLQALELEKVIAAIEGAARSVLEGSEAFLDTSAHVHLMSSIRRSLSCRFDHEVAEPQVVRPSDVRALLAAQSAQTRLAVEGATFIRSLECHACGESKPVLELRERESPETRTCRGCGGQMTASGFATSGHIPAVSAAAWDGPELGLPPGELLTLREADGPPRFVLVDDSDAAADVTTGKIVIVGVGNIGSHLVPLVARMPTVTEMLLVDPDTYETKNLGGQSIATSHVGRAKVDVQADAIRMVAPHVRVQTHRCTIEALPTGHLAHAIVLGCLDSRGARLITHRKSWRMNSVYIDSAVYGADRQVKLAAFRPSHDGPCLECNWDADDYAAIGDRYACDVAATHR